MSSTSLPNRVLRLLPPPGRLRNVVIALAIFIVAMAIRLLIISLMHFSGDEAAFFNTARGIADGDPIPVFGPQQSTGGKLPGSLFLQLIAIPQLFSRSPEASAGLVAGLSALSAVLLWDGLRRHFGQLGAVTAGILYALLPWTVLMSCSIWTPYVALSASAITLWAALRVRREAPSWTVAVLVAVAGWMPQFHGTGIVVWIPLTLLVLPVIRHLRWRWVALGAAAGLAPYLPGLVSELGTGFENLQKLFASSGSGEIRAGYEYTPLYALRFMTLDVSYHGLTGYWGGLDEAGALRSLWDGTDSIPFNGLSFAALLASVALALGAVGTAVWEAIREKGMARSLLIAAVLALVGAAALLKMTGQQIFAHYVCVILPYWVALYAVLGSRLSVKRWHRRALVGVVAVVAIAGVHASLSVAYGVDAQRGLSVKRAVVETIMSDGEREENQLTPVQLHLAAPRQGLHTYKILAHATYQAPFRFARGTERSYRLQPASQRPPSGRKVARLWELHGVALYRLFPRD